MLVAQLDYIYFFFGLVLFLLGSVCVSMSRSSGIPTPWWLLGAFAFVHGVAEWLQLFALTGGDSGPFRLLRTAVIGASFVLLLEFARRTTGLFRRPPPGPWIHFPAVAVLVVALTAGPGGLDSAVRLFIGAPACLWTAALFFTAASRTEALGGNESSWRARMLGGSFFAAFGLVAGLVVPPAPFVPSQWPSPQAFLAWTGIPIQLVRAVLVGGIALSVWALAVSFDPKGRVLRKRRILFWAIATALVTLIAVGWIFTDRLGRLHDRDAIAEAESSAYQVHDHLLMEMRGAERGARALADLLGRYHVTATGVDASRLDGVVDAIAVGMEGVAYVLDPTGKTIATSNRGAPDSFMGKSFAVRPYFQAARDGRPGRFTGVGLVSGLPGYYASEPVRDHAGQVVAIAVVKENLDAGTLGRPGVDDASIVADDGRVVVSSRAGDAGRLLWNPAASAERVPGVAPPPTQGQAVLDRAIAGTEWVWLAGQRTVAVRRAVPNSDWSLVVFKNERTQVANRFLGIVITLLLCAVLLTYFVAMQRQLSVESDITVKRHEAEGRAREAARRADTDALTGVLNRMGFNQAIAREVERARRYRQQLSVAILDIDHFKKVNDEFGHPAGDQVLSRTAKLVLSCVRDSDTVARWGGEEFAVIAPVTGEEGAAMLAEKLRSIMAATHIGPRDAVTASFGVAELRPDDTIETLLQRADAALYRAKQSGRNRVCRADPGAGEAPGSRPGAVKDVMPIQDRIYTNTGFAPIDEEHRELSLALHELVRKVNSGKTEEVQGHLEQVIHAVADHFSHEEDLMARHDYPQREAHAAAHAAFVTDARRSQRGLLLSGITPDFRRWAVGRLPEWFRFHILTHDIGLAQFLVRAGVEPGADAKAGAALVDAGDTRGPPAPDPVRSSRS